MEAEMADALGATKSERTEGSNGYRSGYYGRSLITRRQAGIAPTNKTLWGESVLWGFGASGYGAAPQASLIVHNRGDLYGTTTVFGGTTSGANCSPYGCGTVFELTLP
jgi:hypothetical protein